jgi:outer membrane murein-binding lipoprotein Lpp
MKGMVMKRVGTPVVIAMVVLGLVLLSGCSSDPTASIEYQGLEQQLAEMTAERDALAGQVAEPWSVQLPDEAAEALANYSKAVTAADGKAMLDYVTEGFTFLAYGDAQQRDAYAAQITAFYGDFKVEVLGEPMVLGGGDTYIVAEPERVTTPALASGFSVFRLTEVDGVWLVDAHRFTGE